MKNCKTASTLTYVVLSSGPLLCNVENKNDKIIRHKHVFFPTKKQIALVV